MTQFNEISFIIIFYCFLILHYMDLLIPNFRFCTSGNMEWAVSETDHK